jgi:hypothetical protein
MESLDVHVALEVCEIVIETQTASRFLTAEVAEIHGVQRKNVETSLSSRFVHCSFTFCLAGPIGSAADWEQIFTTKKHEAVV